MQRALAHTLCRCVSQCACRLPPLLIHGMAPAQQQTVQGLLNLSWRRLGA